MGELEGRHKCATDPIWSLNVNNIEKSVTKPLEPILYYLKNGPKRGFVRELLLVVPPNSVLPSATPWHTHATPRLLICIHTQRYQCHFVQCITLNQMGSSWCCSPLPTDLMPLAAEHVHFIPKDFFGEQCFFVMFMLYLFFHHIFFVPFYFFYVFSSVRVEYILGWRQTHSVIGVSFILSFIFPKTFLFALLYSRWSLE